MIRFASIGLCVSACLLAACAPMASPPAGGGPAVQGKGVCSADRVAWAVGQHATQDVMKKIWQQSGAGLIRPIAPDQVVRQDTRADRINVHIDGGNVITGVDCR